MSLTARKLKPTVSRALTQLSKPAMRPSPGTQRFFTKIEQPQSHTLSALPSLRYTGVQGARWSGQASAAGRRAFSHRSAVMQAQSQEAEKEERTGDGVQHILNEHAQFKRLAEQIGQTSNAEQKRQLVDFLVKRVSVHTSCEERFVHGLVRDRVRDGAWIYQKLLADDTIDKTMLDFLLKCPVESSVFDWACKKAELLLSEHIAFEEKVFPMLREQMSKDELAQLENDFIAGEATAPTYPHPNAPQAEMAAKMTHAASGLLDKAKDAVMGRPADKVDPKTGK